VARYVADHEPDPVAVNQERVVPVAADVGAAGGGQVAHGQVQPADAGQGVGQDGTLQGFRDGVLAGEGVRSGQAVRQSPGELLDHLDVHGGEAGPVGVTGEAEDTDRALVHEQRDRQDALGLQAAQDVDQVRGEVAPLRQLRLGVAHELSVPGGVGDLDRHRAYRRDLVLPELGEHRGPGGVTVNQRGGVQRAVGGRQPHHAMVAQHGYHQVGGVL